MADKKMKTYLLASAPSREELEKAVNEYFFSYNNYTITDNMQVYNITKNCYMENIRVVVKKGMWRLERYELVEDKQYMVWGKMRTGRNNEPFVKFHLCPNEKAAKRYIKENRKYYDDLNAYLWSRENHELNYNPNTPWLHVSNEYMYPLDAIYKT